MKLIGNIYDKIAHGLYKSLESREARIEYERRELRFKWVKNRVIDARNAADLEVLRIAWIEIVDKALSHILIEDANLPGIGTARLQTLHSSELYTALDIYMRRHRLRRVELIGKGTQETLINWAQGLLPSKDSLDIECLRAKYTAEYQQKLREVFYYDIERVELI